MQSANEIRQQFIDFFVEKHGHTFVPSSSVVPLDDPTLLFTNAGMNQFKDVFLGTGSRPYKRAVNTQKCIRAGGKHNDLDDVGKDTYHHTFFEMLGNWSFGDYFKKEAIAWAWELLTGVWGLDKGRLHATVFEGGEGVPRDDEAYEFWKTQTDIDHSHIHWGSKKDNFWEMGETGPCGPCTEVHYDRTPDKTGGVLVNAGKPEVIEIWNLVFIQFNRDQEKKLTPLPAKHVDTGMGFERITAVLQGKTSNYDTDVFSPIFAAISAVTGAPPYGGKLDDLIDTAYRVIADHIRALTFALSDGAIPGNTGRNYVLRRILRRAARYGQQYLATTKPFLCELVPAVVGVIGTVYPELNRGASRIAELIYGEEMSFIRTLGRAIKLFQHAAINAIGTAYANKRGWAYLGYTTSSASEAQAMHSGGVSAYKLKFLDASEQMVEVQIPGGLDQKRFVEQECEGAIISGEDAFQLHDTYGVYIDINEQMAAEVGLPVDRGRFEELMAEARERARGRPPQEVAEEMVGKLADVPKDLRDDVFLEILAQAKASGRLSETSESAINIALMKTDDSPKYKKLSANGKVSGWVTENVVGDSGQFNAGDALALILDKTNFYAEQGGQVGDKGTISSNTGTFQVHDTRKLGNAVLHIGKVVEGSIKVGQRVTLQVSDDRPHTMRNHTATHLLNWALRKVLGEHIEQKGSLVDAQKTRFDFAHDEPLTREQVAEVERLVNEKIYSDLPVTPVTMALAEAKQIPGVRAVFGEKYPDPVRVLLIGVKKPEQATEENSVEFCGGTHLTHTGEAGFFKIVSQELVAKGVRRVTAVTGKEAVAAVQRLSSVVADLTGKFNCKPEDVANRIDAMQEEIKKLQQQLKKGAASDLLSAADKLLSEAAKVNGATVIVGEMPAGPDEQMRNQIDRLKQKAGSAVVVFGWRDDGKVGLLAAVTDDLVQKGLHAGKLVGQVAKVVGGGGGGKPTLAQAGGKEPSKLAEALELAGQLAKQQLAS